MWITQQEKRLPYLLLGIASAFGFSSAALSAPKAELAQVRLNGGLHLGMTPADFDRLIRTNPSWNEATVWDKAECSELDLASEEKTGPPFFVKEIDATDSLGARYAITFALEDRGMVAERVFYAERRPSASWQMRLKEAEKRFGKADWTGREGESPAARWCTPGDKNCFAGEYASLPNLTLTFFPYSEGQLDPGDRLDYELSRGDNAADTFRTAWYESLKMASVDARGRLRARCQRGVGGFHGNEDMLRHYASLTPVGRNASPATTSPHAVPIAAFAAIGIDATRTFAKGVCFNSSDVWLDEPECPGGQTGVGFRWARRVGDMWLLAMKFGGNSLRHRYFAVRQIAPDLYSKVWWDDGIFGGVAQFTAWRAKGAVPMVETRRED